MDIKTLLLRLAALIAIAIGGGLLYAITANILILINLMPEQAGNTAFGVLLTQRTFPVWLGAVAAGFAAVFIKDNWRLVLTFAPLYAPAIFAVIYTLMH